VVEHQKCFDWRLVAQASCSMRHSGKGKLARLLISVTDFAQASHYSLKMLEAVLREVWLYAEAAVVEQVSVLRSSQYYLHLVSGRSQRKVQSLRRGLGRSISRACASGEVAYSACLGPLPILICDHGRRQMRLFHSRHLRTLSDDRSKNASR